MKTIIFSLVFVSTIFSQNNDDFLIISVVNSDSIIIPVAGFYGDSLVNIYNRPNNLGESELNIFVWHYYPFESQPSRVFVRESLKFPTGENGLDTTYGFNFGNKDVVWFNNRIIGIASNSLITISQYNSLSKDSVKILSPHMPKSMYISTELRDRLAEAYPKANFTDSLKFITKHISAVKFDDATYYYYENYHFVYNHNDYSDFIFSSGWILKNNYGYKILSERPSLLIYNEQYWQDGEENGEGLHIFGAIRFGQKLYFLQEISVWKSIYYEVDEVDF